MITSWSLRRFLVLGLFLGALLFALSANAAPERKAFLIGPIDTDSLELLQPLSDASPLTLVINSPGGRVDVGLTLWEAISAHGSVTCVVEDLAASMAGVLLQACKTRVLRPHSVIMLHPISTTVQGDADELRRTADVIDAFTTALLERACSRQHWFQPSTCVNRARATWWMSARDAVNWGFGDLVQP